MGLAPVELIISMTQEAFQDGFRIKKQWHSSRYWIHFRLVSWNHIFRKNLNCSKQPYGWAESALTACLLCQIPYKKYNPGRLDFSNIIQPPTHVNFTFVPIVILSTPDLVPTMNATLIYVFTWVAFPTDSRAMGVSKASLVRSGKWETFLRCTVQVNFLLQQLTPSSFCCRIIFRSIFFFFIINEPGYLSQYSDYAYGLGGRVIGGRFPGQPKVFFATRS
jgi:hypothetical protein